jgi:hypothetical protein
MWRYIIAILLLAHGLGHWLGVMPVLGMAKEENWSDDSPLLWGMLTPRATRGFAVVLWILAMAGFVGAGLGVVGIILSPDGVRYLCVASAFVSLLALTLFWNAFPSILNKIGAATFDVSVIAAVLAAPWPLAP